MSVARAYVPLSGSQMYVLPTRITANAQDLASSAARTPASGDQVHARMHCMQSPYIVHVFTVHVLMRCNVECFFDTHIPAMQVAVGDGVLREEDIAGSQDFDVSGETDSLDRQAACTVVLETLLCSSRPGHVQPSDTWTRDTAAHGPLLLTRTGRRWRSCRRMHGEAAGTHDAASS